MAREILYRLWFQSGSPTSQVVYWVLLPNLAAYASITIYECVYATNVFCMNTGTGGITGANPTWDMGIGATTYGEYDNGITIFGSGVTNGFYDNFAGISDSNWVSSSALTYNNGATLIAPNWGSYTRASGAMVQNWVFDTCFNFSGGTSGHSFGGSGQGGQGVDVSNTWNANIYDNGGIYEFDYQINGGHTQIASPTYTAGKFYVSTLQGSNGASGPTKGTQFYLDYGNATGTSATTTDTWGTGAWLGLCGDASATIFYQWACTRIDLPNGVMPTVAMPTTIISPFIPIISNNNEISNQVINITATPTGGLAPYSYQWFYQFPGGSNYIIPPNGNSTASIYNFNTNAMTPVRTFLSEYHGYEWGNFILPHL